MGINTSVTSGWKKRNTDPPAKYLLQICEVLDISVEYLLTGYEPLGQSKRNPLNIRLNNEGDIVSESESMQKIHEIAGRLDEADRWIFVGRMLEALTANKYQTQGRSKNA